MGNAGYEPKTLQFVWHGFSARWLCSMSVQDKMLADWSLGFTSFISMHNVACDCLDISEAISVIQIAGNILIVMGPPVSSAIVHDYLQNKTHWNKCKRKILLLYYSKGLLMSSVRLLIDLLFHFVNLTIFIQSFALVYIFIICSIIAVVSISWAMEFSFQQVSC